MKSLFSSADAETPAASPGTTGWQNVGEKAKVGIGIAAVAGIAAAVVLSGWGDKPPPPQATQQQPQPSTVSEYVAPASQGLIEQVTTLVDPLVKITRPTPRRYVPTEIGLYVAPRAASTPPPSRPAAPAQEGEDGARPGVPDPSDRLAQQLGGATVLPATRAVLVKHPDYTIRPGDPVQCTPQDANNSSMPGFIRCRTPEWTRGHTMRRGLLPPGTEFFGQIRRGLDRGEQRIAALYTSIEGTNFTIPISAPGGDAMGRPGLPADTQTFFWEKLLAVGTYSLLDIGIGAGQNLASSALSQATLGRSGTTLNLGGQVQGLASQEMQSRTNRPPVGTRDQGLPILVTIGQTIEMYDICIRLRRYDAMACPVISE